MTKVFDCSTVFKTCDIHIEGDSIDDILKKVKEHVEKIHKKEWNSTIEKIAREHIKEKS
jgi:predicted small metal-binding protein